MKYLEKLKDLLCEGLGWVLFMPPALITHIVWGVYGMLAYPLALLGCNATRIIEPYTLQVGPMYVSSKLFKSWLYYGCEPESADDPNHLKIDTTFAARFWMGDHEQWWAENMRGNETKVMNPGAIVTRKASGI